MRVRIVVNWFRKIDHRLSITQKMHSIPLQFHLVV